MANYKTKEYSLNISSNELIDLIEGSIEDDILDKNIKFGNGLVLLTGSGGLERILNSDKTERVEKSIFKKVCIEGERDFEIGLEHMPMYDSQLLDSRSYKGYPVSSYTIIIIWLDEVLAVLKPTIKR